MIDLNTFANSYNTILEYRTKKQPTQDAAKVDMEELKQDFEDANKKKDFNTGVNMKPGESVKQNGSKCAAIDPPTPEDEAEYESLDPNMVSENARRVYEAIESEQNFFIQGKAGWAKTQTVTKAAHQLGYHVVTVYMHQAAPEDLGGIPTPGQNDDGTVEQKMLPPTWCTGMLKILSENPKAKFLLFLDELNQAHSAVLNALMPIVLEHTICDYKFENMIVGAAGNFNNENKSVTDIKAHKPLWKRFPFHITWETNTPASWASHFEWAHKHYDNKIGADIINKCEECCALLSSPRDITLGIYDYIFNNTKKNKKFWGNAEGIYERIMAECIDETIAVSELEKPANKTKLQALAQLVYDTITNTRNKDKAGENAEEEKQVSRKHRAKKGGDQIDPSLKATVKKLLISGTLNHEGKKYMVTKENILTHILDPEEMGINAEILEKICREITTDNKKIKFMTDEEGREFIKKTKSSLIDPATVDN